VKRHTCVHRVKADAHRVDADLNCIKGGGACQLREKVLAEAARTFVSLFLPHGIGVKSSQVCRRRRLQKELNRLGYKCKFYRRSSPPTRSRTSSTRLAYPLKYRRLHTPPSYGACTPSLIHQMLPCAWRVQRQVQWSPITVTSSSTHRFPKPF
jgi:Ribose 5-phosphate isomerase A (phosphoriboisomerase A)